MIKVDDISLELKLNKATSQISHLKYEISNLFSFFNAFPNLCTSNNLKICLLNDTRRSKGHLGCSTVVSNIAQLCRLFGHDIIYYDSTYPNDRYVNPDYCKFFKIFDLVLCNGEGTLHDNHGLNLLKKCQIAKDVGLKCVLMNTVWERNSKILDYLDCFDLISVRESLSFSELPDKHKYKSFVVPDMTFYNPVLNNSSSIKKETIIITDSVLPKVTNDLRLLSEYLEAPFYSMKKKNGTNLLTEEIFKHCSKIITGRFHTLTFAMKYGIPTLVINSNTHKSKGILKDADLSNYLIQYSSFDELVRKALNFTNLDSYTDFIEKSNVYKSNARIAQINFFRKVFQMFPNFQDPGF